MRRVKKAARIVRNFFIGFIVLFIIFSVYFFFRVKIPLPVISSKLSLESFKREQVSKDYFRVNNCWLKKNKYGVWEMYIEGEDYERGLIYGILAKELMQKQEECFVKQINELVPNKLYQTGLKYFVAWFNRDIYKYIPLENQREIYGISLSFSDKFDYVGPKYQRILNYHAAHDIGHALNDYSMVGCTSFAVTNKNSADSKLLIGRNFDFSLGDEFAKDKLLVFVNPKAGYKYASYSWAGLTGVVSGMNEKGLTVTLNAAKSDLPFASKEPISILAREILQYSKNIAEAIAIAQSRETFVSESLLIGSAEDGRAVVIEKSPMKMDVFNSIDNQLICSNHYQGQAFAHDSINLNNIANSDSKYRYDRVNELLKKNMPLTVENAVTILRNQNGMNEKNVGLGNPKSLNQLIAHHSILFKPAEKKMWISAPPYQLGAFVCYDLNKVFSGASDYIVDSLTIKADNFSNSSQYKIYEGSKPIQQSVKKFAMFGISYTLTPDAEAQLIESNPNSYLTYMALGDYYKKIKNYAKAKNYYFQALKLEVGSKNDIRAIAMSIVQCERQLAK